MNKLLYILLPVLLLTLSAGCAGLGEEQAAPLRGEAAEAEAEPLAEEGSPAVLDLSDHDALPDGVAWEEDTFVIGSAGEYRVFGETDCALLVEADGPVGLILEGAAIRSADAIRIDSKDTVRITAGAGTVNTVSDGRDQADDTAEAAIRSKAPLVLDGEGTLAVLAGGNNGIRCKNTLTIESGTLVVQAANNGIKADDGIVVAGGTVDIRCYGDGMKAEAGRILAGDITVTGGAVSVSAAGCGLRAEGTVSVAGGTLGLSTTGDAVKARYIEIAGGSVGAAAGADGLQAEEEIGIAGGTLTVTAGENGICAATVALQGGDITVISSGDGIQGDTAVSVAGGTLSVTAGDGSGSAINKAGDMFGPWMRGGSTYTGSSISAKGIKSDGEISITGGTIALDTEDDAVHAATLCTIGGCELTIASSDDALHSDDMLVIQDGVIRIDDCFEGLEAFAIEVHGGDITIRAVNDGINANGSEFGMMGGPWGRRGENTETEITSLSGTADTYFRQTGGSIDLVVTGNYNNVGDGIDSNGYVYIEGGTLTVSTFGNTQEGGIDTGRSGPIVTGGMVMAGGAAMMQESWAKESTQCCAVLTVDLQPGGTPVTIYDEDGNEIWSVTLENTFNCIVLSHPDLLPGHVYTVDYGGGTATLDFTSSTILRLGSGGFGSWGFR